jgi:O-methyltransferase
MVSPMVRFKSMFLGRFLRKMFPSFAELAATVRFRTYMEDGLITRHTADFLKDERFASAYAKGKATGSWNKTNPRWRVYTACWAASQAANLPGDFVECGVNRGGMALTIMEYLNFNALNKRFFLLDTFSGFPEGSQPAEVNRGQYSDCFAEVRKTFAPYPGVRIVHGVVPDTLSSIDAEQISYLSLDMNCAEPEIAAARELWPRLVHGAVILLDDYGGGPAYARQKNAFDALADELRFKILTLPTGQGLIIKIARSGDTEG